MNLAITPQPVQSTTPATTGNANSKLSNDLKSLRKSCRQFEAIFIDQMYKSMRKSLPAGGLIPKDNATKMYQDMLDMQMAKKTAEGKGTGIGEAMYNQLKVYVEAQDK